METSNNQISQTKKTFSWVLTAILWLATVGLGVLAFIVFQQGLQVRSGVLLLGNNEMGATARSGIWRVIRYSSLLLGGLVWLAMVIGGMEYHFNRKRLGQRSSYRIFAWTLGIEIALIGVGLLLQTA